MSNIIREGFASQKIVLSAVPFVSENKALKDHVLLTCADGTTEVMSADELAAYGINLEAQAEPVEADPEPVSIEEEPVAPSEVEVVAEGEVVES